MPGTTFRRLLCEIIHWLEGSLGCISEPTMVDDLARRGETAIRRASEFLVARQDDDGAWRSREDDDFANGHALTAHVLRALRAFPQPAEVGDAVARGFDFVETMFPDGDTMNTGSPPLLYPMTTAAGALYLLATSNRRRRTEMMPVLVRYLCNAQYNEDTGYGPEDIEYGGFGYRPARAKGDPGERVPEFDYPHLAAVMFVVEALALSEHPGAREALRKARIFVGRCQNYAEPEPAGNDGGFVFSPAIASLNKAGPEQGNATGFRSYGTMTANGLRLLSILGYGTAHPRFVAAAEWLRGNFRADAVPGEFTMDRLESQASVYYYYVWTVAHALQLLGRVAIDTPRGNVYWARELTTQLIDRQLPDGMWRNDAAARKESLIPIADMVALPALAICQTFLSQHR
jgi:hypothetical protein